jgi:hypothetical protein
MSATSKKYQALSQYTSDEEIEIDSSLSTLRVFDIDNHTFKEIKTSIKGKTRVVKLPVVKKTLRLRLLDEKYIDSYIIINPKSIKEGLFEVEIDNKQSRLYPTIFSEMIYSDAIISKMMITNISGQIVFESNGDNSSFDLSKLNKGLYIAQYKVDGHWFSEKLIK